MSLGRRLVHGVRARVASSLTAVRVALRVPSSSSTVAMRAPELRSVPIAHETNYAKDVKIPPTDRNRMPITILQNNIGKDHLPPPSYDAPFRPYKSAMISDKFGLGLIENPMTDPYLVDKTALTPQESADFKKYRYPAWAWAGIRGLWRYFYQTVFDRRPLWRVLTDQQLCEIYSRQWPYRSLLTRNKAGDTETEKEYVLDTTVMSKLVPYRPYFTHGSKVYFRRKKIPADEFGPARGMSDLEGYRILRIDRIIMDGGDVLRPDGSTKEHEWDLAKMFAMQGAHYMIKFGQHAILHFPHDAFLRITKEYFAAGSMIRQMLEPHFEFVHTINFTVLFGKQTVLNSGGRGTPWIFDIQTCDREQIQGMLRVANSQKPSFATRALNHKLQPYYEAVSHFVNGVVDYWWAKATPTDKGNVKKWGAALHHYMGFPIEHVKDVNDEFFNKQGVDHKGRPVDPSDPNAFLLQDMDANPTALKIILTDYIFRISVMHSADHWGFMQVPCNVSPMVMRVPYSRGGYISKERPPYTRIDDLKGFMYNEVFVAWTNNALFHDDRLETVKYSFTDPKLRELADAFRAELSLAELAIPYGEIPLVSVCKTLEW